MISLVSLRIRTSNLHSKLLRVDSSAPARPRNAKPRALLLSGIGSDAQQVLRVQTGGLIRAACEAASNAFAASREDVPIAQVASQEPGRLRSLQAAPHQGVYIPTTWATVLFAWLPPLLASTVEGRGRPACFFLPPRRVS